MKNEENVKISQIIVKNTRKKDYGCWIQKSDTKNTLFMSEGLKYEKIFLIFSGDYVI